MTNYKLSTCELAMGQVMLKRRFSIKLRWLLAAWLGALVIGCGGPQPLPAIEAQAAAPEAAKPPAGKREGDMLPHPFPERHKAPTLDGGVSWINTSGPLDLKDLRGKFVVLDFWTYCCINCMHVLPVLKQLEQAYPNEVVVIGVHSAKFETEQDSKNIAEAVQRYEIQHPVVNDAEHRIWNKYSAQSWPSLRVIDPEGFLIAGHSGEIDFNILDQFFKSALPYYRQEGLLDTAPLHFDLETYKARRTPLRFPGKVLADERGKRLFIADSNHNRIVIAGLDGALIEVVGSGAADKKDGDYRQATFDHPQGMALHNETLYVADTENHLLRKIDLAAKRVSTVAGTGKQAQTWPGMDESAFRLPETRLPSRFAGKPLKTALNSPWALWVHAGNLYVAMAGPHQIWKMSLDESEIGVYAGNGREDIVDGPLTPAVPYAPGFASFAQPSGLTSDGRSLFVADSEGSSIRALPFDGSGSVRTIVGTAHLRDARLFTFGDVDGAGAAVRLQHALGITWHRGALYVADTYNNKIKRLDPAKLTCTTIAGTGKAGADDQPATFDEPAGLSAAGDRLFIADTNNHLIRTIDLAHGGRTATLTIKGLEPPPQMRHQPQTSFAGAAQVMVEETAVKPAGGQVVLQVRLDLPIGYKINPLAPLRYRIEGNSAQGVVDRSVYGKLVDQPQKEAAFDIPLPIRSERGQETLRVSLAYYYCQSGPGGLCKGASVVWTVPIKIDPRAASSSILLASPVQ